MLYIDMGGYIDHVRITRKIYPTLEHGPMNHVHGIVVHQTTAATIGSTFNAYQRPGANGAHFLIDKDGTIYQTASLMRVTYHVGEMQSRCLIEKKCPPTELKATSELNKSPMALHQHEKAKAWPDRFPNNSDAIGIALVGAATKKDGVTTFETVTDAQNTSLKWLVGELEATLGVSPTEVYRHPDVGRKTPDEARTATW